VKKKGHAFVKSPASIRWDIAPAQFMTLPDRRLPALIRRDIAQRALTIQRKEEQGQAL